MHTYIFCSYTYQKILFIFEIQEIEYFRDQPCRSLIGTEIGVFISGIDLNYQCIHFLFCLTIYVSFSIYIASKFKDFVPPKIPYYVVNWCVNSLNCYCYDQQLYLCNALQKLNYFKVICKNRVYNIWRTFLNYKQYENNKVRNGRS